MVVAAQTTWKPDVTFPDYEALTISLPDDYEGRVIATLVRKRAPFATKKAVLYIHGYIDYFFQRHLAEAYNAHGYNFYALDLRKYGRSLLPHQHPNYCKSLSEYYPEISYSIRQIIEPEGNNWLLLNGHSTGGLLSALYAHEGDQRERINALFLNSPFFEFNVSAGEHLIGRLAAQLGRIAPFGVLRNRLSPHYGHSIHRDFKGEWNYDLRWKPTVGFPVYLGWLLAIMRAHKRVQSGLDTAVPVLLMHSHRTETNKSWVEAYRTSDGVLNPEHMKTYGPGLGKKVTVIEIRDGLHDLSLSRADIRERVFTELFGWLARVQQPVS